MTRLARLVLGSTCAALALFGAAANAQPLEVKRGVASVMRKAADALSGGDPAAMDEVEGKLSRLIDGRRATAYERSILLDLRGRIRATRGDVPGALADFDAALALDVPEDGSRAATRLIATQLLGAIGRNDALVAFYEAHADGYGWSLVDVAPTIAQAYAATGRPDEGLALLTRTAEEQETGGAPLHAYRFVMLLQMGRLEEARAALADYERAVPGPSAAIAPARAATEGFGADTPKPRLREAAVAFLTADTAWRARNSDATPRLRVPPEGFERCLKGPTGTVQTVRMVFDVDAEGMPRDVTVTESTDGCFDPYAVASVQRWRYDPAIRDGEPALREGIETQIKFEIAPPNFGR